MTEQWDEDYSRTYANFPNNDHAQALAAGDRLLNRPDFPHHDQVRQNLTWYLTPLPGTRHDITLPVPAGWSCFNPSIAAGPDGELRAIIRTANYVLSPAGRYGGSYDDERVIRTTNHLGTLDDALVWDGAPITDAHLRQEPSLYPVEGFEDARLFYHRGWKFSATVRDRNARGICQQVMCSLRGQRATTMQILSPAHDAHEKNWMPIFRPWVADPAFVRTCYPTVVSGGRWVEAPYLTRAFRGGSPLIRVDIDARLAVVHESVDFPGQQPHRVYWHRFVIFQHDRITAISRPFCFQGRGVEFAAGMALRGDDLIISYGVGDASAWLHVMPVDDALAMVQEIA